ncbi:MAG: hypothetical protein KGL99_18075 [Burkholderiales bacterium]|nr:hypothetical protein [Burkholderiales bacterium]MDE2629059.1 hypothetical protein [Burkholderiales bacterium]
MTGIGPTQPVVHGSLALAGALAGVMAFAIVVGTVGLLVCAAWMIGTRVKSVAGALRARRDRRQR